MPGKAVALGTAYVMTTSVLVLGCSAIGGPSTPNALLADGAPSSFEASSDPSDGGPPLYDATASETSALACSVLDPASCPDPPLHYADVAPIFQNRCVVCHSGVDGGPWPLTDYWSIEAWEDLIRIDLLDCTMPPLDGGVSLTRDERTAILTWIRCALPQ